MEGYDNIFLGNDCIVDLPNYSHYNGKIAKNKLTNGDIIPYTYYSVLQNKSRRVPIFSASNILRTAFMQEERVGTFKIDDRIAEFEQLSNKDYAAFNSIKEKAIDKGHMTKREDVQWDAEGDSEKAQKAAERTFFYTNAAPQHKKLNVGLWKRLENAIIIKGRVKKPGKVSVFTGPVLDKNDPEFNARLHDGSRFKIPILFWKIVYYVSGEELFYAGFLMGQTNPLLNDGLITIETGLDVEDTRTLKPFLEFNEDEKYQVSVSFIEDLTMLKFTTANDRHEGREPTLLKEVEIQGMGIDGFPSTIYTIEGLNI